MPLLVSPSPAFAPSLCPCSPLLVATRPSLCPRPRTFASLSFQAVQAAAARRGIVIRNSGVGPFAKLCAFRETGEQIGALTAALLPGGRVHIESYKALARSPDGALLKLSPGMFLFIASIALGSDRGCQEVYGLAINDEPRQHARLLAYLKRFGGEAVRRVNEDSIVDRLVYGGRGMIIRGSIPEMLGRAEGMIKRTTPLVSPLFHD